MTLCGRREKPERGPYAHRGLCSSSLPPLQPSWAIEINCLWSNQQKQCKLKSRPRSSPTPSLTSTAQTPSLLHHRARPSGHCVWRAPALIQGYKRVISSFPGEEYKARKGFEMEQGVSQIGSRAHTHTVPTASNGYTGTGSQCPEQNYWDLTPLLKTAPLPASLSLSGSLIKKPLERRAAQDHMTLS